MNNNNDRVLITSSVFIVTLMVLDSILSNEPDKIPRETMGGLLLITMLSVFEFVGLGRISGPFAVLIASTVFFTRGGRIFVKLSELQKSDTASGGGTSSFG